jgi:hypothetical protein
LPFHQNIKKREIIYISKLINQFYKIWKKLIF